ncbi:MAG TPA: cytochrome c-type biogenesis protein CcmH [Terriglobia bacterium]|nr:cytochrome c-type biogenesis protein CcmH [Terriglobia bacterium]
MKQSINRRAFLRGLLVAAALPAATVIQAADRDRMNDLGERLMCMCGCGQLLIKCNHTNCPKSVPMLKELAAHIDSGESDQEILSFFVQKYGTAVNPSGGSQGQIAKAVSYVALAAGAVTAVVVVRRWKHSADESGRPAAPEGEASMDSEYHRRAEEDLKNLTPED